MQLQFDQDTLEKIKQAQAYGYSSDQIMQKASQYQATKAQPQQPAPQQPKGSWADILPTVGGVAGSFIPGVGAIGGGAAGAGLGTLLKQLIEQKPVDVGEIGKESAFAGLGGVGGKLLGGIASKLFPTAAKALTGAGESLGVKAFRANSGQLTNFNQDTGEDFGKFLAKRGFNGPEDVNKRADLLQNEFDKVVLNKNISIDPSKIVNGFQTEIDRLSKDINPANRAKAETLQKIALNFIDQYGKGPMDAATITGLRREVDQGIKDFSLDQSVKGPLNHTRDILQNALRDAADNKGVSIAGKSLKDTGVELSKLYKAMEIGDRQGNLGRGNLPTRLTTLLAGGIGGATGGVPGAMGSMAAAETLNNPATISLLSKFAAGAGNAASKVPTMPESGINAFTRAGVGAGAGAPQMPDQSQGQPPMDASMIPQPGGVPGPLTPGLPGDQSGIGAAGDNMQQDQLRKVIASIMFSHAKNVGDLKTAFDILQPNKPAAKPLAAEQQKIKANAESGLRSLSVLEGILQKDSNAPLKAGIPVLNAHTPYLAAAKDVADVLTRLRTGAQINEEELKMYMGQLPQPFDSQDTVNYKLSIFRNLFNQLAYGQQPTGGSDSSASPMPNSQ